MATADGGAPMGWREVEGGRCERSEGRGDVGVCGRWLVRGNPRVARANGRGRGRPAAAWLVYIPAGLG